jgi:hypothetical protein
MTRMIEAEGVWRVECIWYVLICCFQGLEVVSKDGNADRWRVRGSAQRERQIWLEGDAEGEMILDIPRNRDQFKESITTRWEEDSCRVWMLVGEEEVWKTKRRWLTFDLPQRGATRLGLASALPTCKISGLALRAAYSLNIIVNLRGHDHGIGYINYKLILWLEDWLKREL